MNKQTVRSVENMKNSIIFFEKIISQFEEGKMADYATISEEEIAHVIAIEMSSASVRISNNL